MAERGTSPTAGCEGSMGRLAVASAVAASLLLATVTADAQMPAQPITATVPPAAPAAASVEAIVPPIRRIHPSRLVQ